MALLLGDVSRTLIAPWLGHESAETTQVCMPWISASRCRRRYKAAAFGGKPRSFGTGLLSFGDRITGFVVLSIEIASLRAQGRDRANCIGRIERTIHLAEPH